MVARRKLKTLSEHTMNKSKFLIATASRALLNVFMVFALVALASLIGVGGAALWIYGRPGNTLSVAKQSSLPSKVDATADDTRDFPRLSPVRSDVTPAQLTAARYMPTDTEIATLSDTPRYTNISYNGGRQQAYLLVNTVLSSSPAASIDDESAPVQDADRPPLTDTASHYITDDQGRVVGIDGSAGAVADAREQHPNVARALPVQSRSVAHEVRVASPVAVRKAMPVDDDATAPSPTGFNVQDELARDDDRPVLRAEPVARAARSARPSMFGASDDLNGLGRN